ncbi:MAG: hypothetical protein AVDCRST_MAG85-4081 [uncultured Solirubrobacteraceae bacterium]|uniref:HTH arsR-type domain-containing protein n=1 Tax=uncultured Solirubrobacteraceae bacterium TaxID=1162706 RepID=A0A6J4U0D7_9ACTN|nr:MAG: hypothetical protein AVDCRST_MAG85-4081 [uncultured Solirubrobacteraceae bacterium]
MASDGDDFGRKVHRALAHPLRVRILELARERDEISPVDVSEEVGESLGVVSYHVRALASAGLLELSGRTFRRGAVKHHYTATPQLGLTLRARMPAERAGEVAERIRAVFKEAGEGAAEDDPELTVVVHHSSGTNAS